MYYLTFNGFSFTVDHSVWSNNAVRCRISLDYLEFHSTHTSAYEKDITFMYWPVRFKKVRL